jgi:hypothetical protein
LWACARIVHNKTTANVRDLFVERMIRSAVLMFY